MSICLSCLSYSFNEVIILVDNILFVCYLWKTRFLGTIESDLDFVVVMLYSLVVPCLLGGNAYLSLFAYRVHERRHVRLVCKSYLVGDDSTAHVVRNYLAVRSEHAAPRLKLFAVVVEYLRAL